SSALRLTACGLLSLVSPQLFLHREEKQPARNHLRHSSQDARTRTNLAATPSNLGEGAQVPRINPGEDSDRFVIFRPWGEAADATRPHAGYKLQIVEIAMTKGVAVSVSTLLFISTP